MKSSKLLLYLSFLLVAFSCIQRKLVQTHFNEVKLEVLAVNYFRNDKRKNLVEFAVYQPLVFGENIYFPITFGSLDSNLIPDELWHFRSDTLFRIDGKNLDERYWQSHFARLSEYYGRQSERLKRKDRPKPFQFEFKTIKERLYEFDFHDIDTLCFGWQVGDTVGMDNFANVSVIASKDSLPDGEIILEIRFIQCNRRKNQINYDRDSCQFFNGSFLSNKRGGIGVVNFKDYTYPKNITIEDTIGINKYRYNTILKMQTDDPRKHLSQHSYVDFPKFIKKCERKIRKKK